MVLAFFALPIFFSYLFGSFLPYHLLLAFSKHNSRDLINLNSQEGRLTEEQFVKNKRLADEKFKNDVEQSQQIKDIKNSLRLEEEKLTQQQTNRATAQASINKIVTEGSKKELELKVNIDKADAELTQKQLERAKLLADAIIKERERANAARTAIDAQELAKLEEEFSKGAAKYEEYEARKSQIAIDGDKVRLANAQKALDDFNALNIKDADRQLQLQTELSQARQKLFSDENSKKEQEAARSIATRSALTAAAQQREQQAEQETIRRFAGDRETAIRKVIQLRLDLLSTELSAAQQELDAAIATNKPQAERIQLQTTLNGLRKEEEQLTLALNGRYDKLTDSTRQLVDGIGQAVDKQNELTSAVEGTNAAANVSSQSVKSLYSSASGLQNTFHDNNADLVSDIVDQTKAGIAAQLQAEAEGARIHEQIVRQEVADIKAAYKDAADTQVELQEKADEDLALAREKRDEERRQVDHDYAKAKRETERQTALNIIEGLQLIAEANSKYEQEKTAIVKEESDRRTEIERQNAEESREIINSTLDGINSDRDKADSDSYEKHRQYLNDLVDLEKERQGAKTQAEISEIDKRIAAREKEEADRLAKEKQRREKGQALEDEFKDKSKGVTDPELLKKLQAEYEAQKENNDKKNELEDQFQEDYNKALADGNEERAAQIKQAYQDELDRLDAQNKIKLDRIQENYEHQKALADAQKAADEAAYQQKLATAEKRHNDEVATIVKNETEKNEKLQEALDDERKRRNRQRERIENEYKESEDRIQNTLQKSLDKVKQQLSDALNAAVGRLNDFGKSGSNALNPLLSQIDQLIAKAQQAIGLTNSLVGANTGASSNFTGNNITSANQPGTGNNLTTASNLGGFPNTNNVTTSPLDSGDSTGNDSSSDSDKDKNGSGKGLAKRVNPGKINSGVPSSANNLTDSPLNSGDQTDSDSGDSDDSDDSDSSGKGPVKQAKTNKVAPGSSQPSFNTNITSTSQQTGDITGRSSGSDTDNTDNGELVGTAPSNGFNPVTKQSRIPSGSPKTKSEYIGLMLAIYSAYLPESPGRFNPALKIVNFTLSFIGDKSKITPEISELMRVATVSLLNRNEADFKSFTSSLADKIDRIVNPKKDQPTNGSPIFTGPGKGPVTQADTPGQTTTPTDANTGPIDDQGDSDAASTGKGPVKQVGGKKISTTKKRSKGQGLGFDQDGDSDGAGAEPDNDSDQSASNSSSGADKGNSNGGKAGGAKGDVIIDVGGVRVDVGVSLSLTLSALTGKNREEVINATIDRIIDQARSKSGKGAQIIIICRDDVFAVLDRELERQGIF